jgi:hypothetical protein
VLRLDDAQKAARKAAQQLEKEQKFQTQLGFRRVFSLLSAAGKPMVGHNCWFDLLFMMQAFHAPLPPTLGEFKRQLLQVFPAGVVDTKFCAHHSVLPGTYANTALDALFAATAAADLAASGAAAAAAAAAAGDGGGGGDGGDGESAAAAVAEAGAASASAGGGAAVAVSSEAQFARYAGDANVFHEAAWDAHSTGRWEALQLHYNTLQLHCNTLMLDAHSLHGQGAGGRGAGGAAAAAGGRGRRKG